MTTRELAVLKRTYHEFGCSDPVVFEQNAVKLLLGQSPWNKK
jgi:hypothetical protein